MLKVPSVEEKPFMAGTDAVSSKGLLVDGAENMPVLDGLLFEPSPFTNIVVVWLKMPSFGVSCDTIGFVPKIAPVLVLPK